MKQTYFFQKACVMMIGLLVISGLANAQLSGNYTINAGLPTSGTNFQTFTEFSNSLTANGVSGNVIATVDSMSGPYTEQVTFQNISGLGASATLTIEGNGAIMTSDTAIEQAGDNPNRHIIRLVNLQYVTINDLNINMHINSTGFIAIQGLTSANHITISNCNVEMGDAISTLLAAFVFNNDPTSVITTGGTFDNILINGNTVHGGGYGVSIFGLDAPNLATNVVISGNTFISFHSNGVYLRETDGTIVRNNNFDKASSQVLTCNAIQVAQADNINAEIFNNDIRVSQTNNGTMTIRGIYLFDGTGHIVYNNVIHDINLTSGNFVGIEIRTEGTAPEIYFNTIAIDKTDSTTGNLYGIEEFFSNTNSILRNNMISISQPTSGLKAALLLGSTSTLTSALNSNYNNLWVPGGNVAQKGTSATPVFYNTLANWQTASTQDANSLSVDPAFQSITLTIPTNPLIDNAGIAIPGITTDILGVIRGPAPEIGAYEMCSDLPVAGFSFTQTGNEFSFTNSSTNATSYSWDFGVTGGVSNDTNPTFTYPDSGTYIATLIVANACGTDTFEQSIVIVGVKEINALVDVVIYPNPSSEFITLGISLVESINASVDIVDFTGRRMSHTTSHHFIAGQHTIPILTNHLSAGAYQLRLVTTNGINALPFVVIR